MTRFLLVLLCFLRGPIHLTAGESPGYTVKLVTVLKHNGDDFIWFHPRATAFPGGTVLTLQKHLKVSDYYSGLHYLIRPGPTGKWVGPCLPPQLDWRGQPDGVTLGVSDVTPGYHPPTGKVIAIGAQVRYSDAGEQLNDVQRSHQTVYSVYDPVADHWTPWQLLELPADEQFDFARNASSQGLVRADGSLLVPLYVSRSVKKPFSTTVAECRFDGEKLTFLRHGNLLRLNIKRGLYEPSLIAFQGRYYLTMRNDDAAYVSTSDDGLNFETPRLWRFDDGTDLGSYNTQQHWLTHGDTLFLVYTRRGANNDHVFRHRAPLFMAEVDPATLRVKRATETVIVPERGASLGNFGANPISADESWVTVSEGMFPGDPSVHGAEGATFIARILWSPSPASNAK